MSTYTQAHRPLAIKTPLGIDVLLLTGIRDHETISQLFNFQLDLRAEAQNEIRFDRIVGQNVTVEMRLAKRPLEKLRFLGLNNLEEHTRDAYDTLDSATFGPREGAAVSQFEYGCN